MTTLFSSRYARWAAAILLLGTIFRLWYSTHLELVGDEAYYWLWSRHPDFCYLDKGPVIAWFISAGTALFGQTVFGVRFFATLLAFGTGIGIFFLARRLFCDRVAFWAVLLSALTPLFAVGATLMTIDTVYIFFWTMAALAFWQAKDQTGLGWWIVTGLLVGFEAGLIAFGFDQLVEAPADRLDRGRVEQPGQGQEALFVERLPVGPSHRRPPALL